jgi:small subunit ribosomal protein S8
MSLDPIADFLTRIRNAAAAKHRYVDVKKSKMIRAIVDVLVQRGFVAKVLEKKDGPQGTLRVFLKYTAGRKSVIQGLKRISSPGLRKYSGAKEVPYVYNGFGISIVSTPKGVLEGSEARKQNVGGELLCCVW